MKMFAKILIGFLAVIIFTLLFGPREPTDGDLTFTPEAVGEDIEEYLTWVEAPFTDITPGVEKQVIWADPTTRARTPISIVYVHGFSATAQEIRPVPDRVAAELGANLFYTRLSGHGRTGDAMAEPAVVDWLDDVAEAMEIGRRIGDRVILMGTSTGATMATIAAVDTRMNEGLAGMIMVSPNFKVAAAGAGILDLPFARYFGPVVAGAERSFEPHNADHGLFWTTKYPTTSLLPMAASVRAANGVTFRAIEQPVLMVFSEDDRVVDHTRTAEIAEEWGGETTIIRINPSALDDPYAHVIAGDIMSPAQTDGVVRVIADWLEQF